jgi:hypothetical protein
MVAVIPRIRARHHRSDRRVFDLADALQLVAQDLGFGFKLGRVGHVLVMTAAALAEVLAPGRNPLRGRFQHFEQICPRKVFFLHRQPDAHQLSRQPKRDKDGATIIQASNDIATVGEFFEFDIQRFGRQFIVVKRLLQLP